MSLSTAVCECSHRESKFMHSLVLTSLALLTAAMLSLRRKRFVSAFLMFLLTITSIGYHGTHVHSEPCVWRCFDVPLCYLTAMWTFVEVCLCHNPICAFVSTGLLVCCAKIGSLTPIPLPYHALMHFLFATAVAALPKW